MEDHKFHNRKLRLSQRNATTRQIRSTHITAAGELREITAAKIITQVINIARSNVCEKLTNRESNSTVSTVFLVHAQLLQPVFMQINALQHYTYEMYGFKYHIWSGT